MEINLYPCFKHWFYNSATKNSIWFFSDPHFNDEESKLFRKDYIGDDELVKRINSKISKNDTLICLGDVGDITFVKKLRGYKVLIKGNHDAGSSKYQRVEHIITRKEIEEKNLDIDFICRNYKKIYHHEIGEYYYYDNQLFDEVYEGTLQISPKIILSHEPIDYKYCFNIHGHNHSGYTDENHMNLCVEHINYTPINLTSIIKSGVLKNIPDIHKETIHTATENKKEKQI